MTASLPDARESFVSAAVFVCLPLSLCLSLSVCLSVFFLPSSLFLFPSNFRKDAAFQTEQSAAAGADSSRFLCCAILGFF